MEEQKATDLSVDELFKNFSEDFSKLENERDIVLRVTPISAWILLANLQLALKHPENIGRSSHIAREVATQIQQAIAGLVPGLGRVAERWWEDRSVAQLPPVIATVQGALVARMEDLVVPMVELALDTPLTTSETMLPAFVLPDDADTGEQLLVSFRVRRCRKCGCTAARSCDGGCEWAEMDLCSRCKIIISAI